MDKPLVDDYLILSNVVVLWRWRGVNYLSRETDKKTENQQPKQGNNNLQSSVLRSSNISPLHAFRATEKKSIWSSSQGLTIPKLCSVISELIDEWKTLLDRRTINEEMTRKTSQNQ